MTYGLRPVKESLQGQTARVEAYLQHVKTTADSGERFNQEIWIDSREDALLELDHKRPW